MSKSLEAEYAAAYSTVRGDCMPVITCLECGHVHRKWKRLEMWGFNSGDYCPNCPEYSEYRWATQEEYDAFIEQEIFDFREALIYLRYGKKVRRKSWPEGNWYCRGAAGELRVFRPVYAREGAETWANGEDLFAEDWQEAIE